MRVRRGEITKFAEREESRTQRSIMSSHEHGHKEEAGDCCAAGECGTGGDCCSGGAGLPPRTQDHSHGHNDAKSVTIAY